MVHVAEGIVNEVDRDVGGELPWSRADDPIGCPAGDFPGLEDISLAFLLSIVFDGLFAIAIFRVSFTNSEKLLLPFNSSIALTTSASNVADLICFGIKSLTR